MPTNTASASLYGLISNRPSEGALRLFGQKTTPAAAPGAASLDPGPQGPRTPPKGLTRHCGQCASRNGPRKRSEQKAQLENFLQARQ
ncbi:hypothetical protein MDA_GLEAN10009105 [Myotis davidii]|uniref:Uncharacterized protein n=1 Tax=Myotis davidii TaxID=225400 RepID=L5LCV6_MYODS|nr:hypothetical protein MDA_GLEAN10009105 [Myotis davidii]